MRNVVTLSVLALLQACSSVANIQNQPAQQQAASEYRIDQLALSEQRSSKTTVVLAFSGGGTRAAAMSYGVLKALRDTSVIIDGSERRLLDEVDIISSVSGGSFTAAYFGLNGEYIFEDFEDDFLNRDVSGALLHGLFSPRLWFSKHGRTEMAIRYYEDILFNGATFADLEAAGGPLLFINASDLAQGTRFSFTQEYFDLLCSDIADFPVARAVTASSAVPVLFNPVILENYEGCDGGAYEQQLGQSRQYNSTQTQQLFDDLHSYSDKVNRRYIHLVDGGITDNLGLLAIHETTEAMGGVAAVMERLNMEPSPTFLVISVNASTKPQYNLGKRKRPPSIEAAVSAMSDVQLHRYNAATIDLIKQRLEEWDEELGDGAIDTHHYFVDLSFEAITDVDRLQFINQIPTSFNLDEEQVDEVIKAGQNLLFSHPEFQRFLDDMHSLELGKFKGSFSSGTPDVGD